MPKFTDEQKKQGFGLGTSTETRSAYKEGINLQSMIQEETPVSDTIPGELKVSENLPEEWTKLPEPVKEIGFFDAAGSALKSNSPLSYKNDNPRNYDPEFNRQEYFDKVVEEHGGEFARDLFDDGGDMTNELYLEQKKANMLEDIQHQQNIYDYGGFSGSLLFNIGASLVNPIDAGLAIATFGASKYVKIYQQLETAYQLGKVDKKTYNTIKTSLGAAEGATWGYSSEYLRQYTNDITNSEDLQMSTLFGGGLGAGVRGFSKIKLEDDFINSLSTSDQKLYRDIQEQELTRLEEVKKEFDEAMNDNPAETTQREKHDGLEATVLNDNEVGTLSKVTEYFTIPNPIKKMYQVDNPFVQSIARTMASPFFIMKNKDGKKITFSDVTAFDKKNMHEARVNLGMRDMGIAWADMNESLVKNGEKPLKQTEFNKMVIQEKRLLDKPIIEVEDAIKRNEKVFKEETDKLLTKYYNKNKKLLRENGIKKLDDLLKADETTLKSLGISKTYKDRIKKINTSMEELVNLNVKLEEVVKNKGEAKNPFINNGIKAFEDTMSHFDDVHYKVQDTKRLKKLEKDYDELAKKHDELLGKLDTLDPVKNKKKMNSIENKLGELDEKLNAMNMEKWEIANRSTRLRTKTYIPAVYKTEELTNNREKYFSGIVEALRNNNKNATDEELETIANNWIDKLITKQNPDDINSYSSGKYDPLNGIFNNSRTLDIDRNKMSELGLMEDEGMDLLTRYGMTMTGKMALKEHLGINNMNELKDLGNRISTELSGKMKPEEIADIKNNLSDVFKMISGDYNIINDPTSTANMLKRVLMPITNIGYGLNFGIVSLAESGQIIAKYGLGTFLSHAGEGFKNTIRRYKNKKNTMEFANQLDMVGVGNNVANSRIMSRFNEGDEIYYSRSKYLDALKYAEGKVFHGGGLILVTESFKDIAATSFIGLMKDSGVHLIKGKKLPEMVKNDMARFGLLDEDLITLAKHDFVKDKNGNITDLRLNDLPTGTRQRLEIALKRSTKGSVLEPDSLDLPKWMTDPNNPLGQMLGQYLRFPIDAHNKLLAAGIDEKNVSTITAIMYSSFISGYILYARENALVESGLLRGDQIRYDMNTEEGRNELIMATMNRTPHLSGIITALNKFLPFIGIKPFASHYLPNPFANLAGPGLATGYLATASFGDFLSDPTTLSKNQARLFGQASVIGASPFAGDLLKLKLKNTSEEQNYERKNNDFWQSLFD